MLEQFLTQTEGIFSLNLLLSLAIGYIIGLERETRGKSAGVSTHILVVGGSMAFSFLSSTMFSDPARIASGIVTGIGFLGAGIIFKENASKIINLTTAASIWFAAGIGMAIGFGYYSLAIIASIFAIVALRVPHLALKSKKR